MKVLLHEVTGQQVEVIRARPKNAYIFHGSAGLGKFSAAAELAAEWAGTTIQYLAAASDVLIVRAEKQSIGIAQIADVIHALQLSRNSLRRRTVIIDGAEQLTTEAQNSLLKILEDSPEQTTTIFITAKIEALLITIRSRSIPIFFAKPESSKLSGYLAANYPGWTGSIANAIELGSGLPGKVISLLGDNSLLEAAGRSRQLAADFMKASLFERLAVSTELGKDPLKAGQLVTILADEATRRLRAPATAQTTARLVELLTALERYPGLLAANVGVKPALDTIAMAL